jgi:hypothetical protein
MNKERLYQSIKAIANGSETANTANSFPSRLQRFLGSFITSKQCSRLAMAALLVGAVAVASKSIDKSHPLDKGTSGYVVSDEPVSATTTPPSSQSQSTLALAAPAPYEQPKHAANESLTQLDVAMLARAQRRIDITMPSFTDLHIAKLLAGMANRGVQIRVYRDSAYYAKEQSHATGSKEETTTTVLRRAGVSVSVEHQGEQMVMPAYVVDDLIVRTGLTGWAPSEHSDIAFTESPAAVTQFDKAFGSMWKRSNNYVVR